MLPAYLPNAFVFKKIFKKILKGGQGFIPGCVTYIWITNRGKFPLTLDWNWVRTLFFYVNQ